MTCATGKGTAPIGSDDLVGFHRCCCRSLTADSSREPIPFPPVKRKLLGAAMLAATVLGPAQPAFAHGGNGGAASDYLIEVTGFEGDPTGVEVHPVELGDRMELVRTTASKVEIVGYDGEPYLRLEEDGVFENFNSPSHYTNLDRFARTATPPTATSTVDPDWVKLSDGNSVRWHDHRTHWMDPTPRQDVRDNPDVERVIFPANRVELVVDGKPVTAIVRVTWLPPPSRTAWLVFTSVAVCALLAALVLVPSLRRFAPTMSVIAGVCCLVGSGTSTFRVMASLVAIVLAVVGVALKNRWLPVVASALVVILAVTHFEVFEHQLLAGWAPEVLQRLGISAAARTGRCGGRIRIGHRPRRHILGRGRHSRTGRGRPVNRFRRAACACAAAMTVATLVGVGKVSAHAELVTSTPQPGAVLETAPTKITLTFSEPVEISLGGIRLFDGTGTSIDVSAARHPDGDDLAVEVDLPALDNGSYIVDWRVVSADSHPVHAAFTFQVGPESNLESGLLDQIISTNDTGGTVGLTISRSLVTASIAIVFGGLLACGLGIVPFGRRQRVVIGASAAIGAVAGALAMPLEVAYTAGRSLDVITDGSAWRAVFDTTIGFAWVVRAVTIALTAGVLLATHSRSRATWWRAVLVAGLVVVGIASAYGGHGATGRWHYLGVLLTMLHVASMAVWLGGLAMLVLSFGDAQRDGVERFSSIALLSVVTVVVTGTMQGFRQVGSWDALTNTSYGQLLIWKLVAVAAVLLVAAVARAATHGRLVATCPRVEASVGAAAAVGYDRARLRRAVTIEAVLAAVVIVITSLLMAANPSQATASAPFSATLTSQGYLATITVAPGRVGTNEVHIYLSSPNSSLEQPDDITVTIQDPSRDIDPIDLTISKAGAGHVISTATFPYAATWRMVVTARYGFDEVKFDADVKIV